MCLGVTAGAYVLTLFAVCVCMRFLGLGIKNRFLEPVLIRIPFLAIDEISGEGCRAYAGFTSLQDSILE
jgi:hypothetical protein